MRLASYSLASGQSSYGIVQDETVLDAGENFKASYPTLKHVLEADKVKDLGEAAAQSAPVGLDKVSLLPPIANPDKILCIGLNYLTHIQETGRAAPQQPAVFTRHASSIVGHARPLVLPIASSHFDYEGELAVVIGRTGRAISADDAMSYIAGYTCFNDGSIRDYQRHTTQFWAGKNFDDSGSVGPWLVTADEVPNIGEQSLVTRLNGEVMQSAPFSDLAFGIPALITYLSTVTTLLPGDIIATGTPGGVGMFRDPQRFMKAGDKIEIEISSIGTLVNEVVQEA